MVSASQADRVDDLSDVGLRALPPRNSRDWSKREDRLLAERAVRYFVAQRCHHAELGPRGSWAGL